MSQVDLLLPQSTLSACELRKSPGRDSYVDINQEPPGGELPNHDDKQAAVDVQESTTVEGPSDAVAPVVKQTVDAPVVKQESSVKEHEVRPQARKKRHRRGKKRKWRPYSKLTWEERKELQDREAKRAEKIRADMCACGMTLAPYNTTQFLMEDHNLQEPDYDHIPVGHHRHRMNSNSNDSSDDFYSSPEDEEDFLQQQFTETYKNIHAERLSNMSNGELVQEIMSLEDKLEAAQKTWEYSQKAQPRPDPGPSQAQPDEESMEKIRVFQAEILKLLQENERLMRENEEYRRRLHL